MGSRQQAPATCKFCGYQSQEGGAKHDARSCDMVTIQCPCQLSPESALFETPPRHIKSCKIQAGGSSTAHCDLCVQDGHTAMTIKYDSLYEKATEKGKVVFRHKRNFTMSATVMVCEAATMTDDYVKSAREAAQKRYAEKDDNHRKEKAANKAYHTAHPMVVARDGAAAGSSAAGATGDRSYAARDLENLMAIASRRGKATAATHVKNHDKLRAAFAYRGAGHSSTSAKVSAAADEAGGLPLLPDGGPRRGRDVLLGVDTPLKKIQTALSVHGAARSSARALALASSPMRLRAPTTSPASRLVANGVVNTIDDDEEPSAAARDASVAGGAVNSVGLLDPSGVFDLFEKQYTIKDDSVYLGLIKKVLVEEGISGAVVIDNDTPVGELVGIFESTMKDAKQWTFGHKRSLDIFFRHCREVVVV